jgi:hypothetical protein
MKITDIPTNSFSVHQQSLAIVMAMYDKGTTCDDATTYENGISCTMTKTCAISPENFVKE